MPRRPAGPPSGPAPEALRRAARGGTCGGCAFARVVPSASGAVYLRCDHPQLPKYPPQPLLRCAGFVPRDGDASPVAG